MRPTHLVVHVEALDVPPVALNHVDKVLHRAVLFEEQLAVVDFVLLAARCVALWVKEAGGARM
eukprot:75113-Chlamydomonas_euryale.AAC.1